jgi:flagellar hook-associated protein 1 FlgK
MSNFAIAHTALSALQGAQAGIALTSQNVEGQSVPGFTRRRLDASTGTVLASGLPDLGTGVEVGGFRRDWNALLQQQRVGQAGVTGYNAAVTDGLAGLDRAVVDPALALDTPVNAFFTSLAALARNPQDASALSAVKARGQNLLGAAQQFQSAMTTVQQDAREGAASGLARLNAIASELALVNQDIARSGDVGQAPATLDRRDALLLEAGRLAGGHLGLRDDGTAFIDVDGQPLVNGGTAARLMAAPPEGQNPGAPALSIRFGVDGQEPPPVTLALRSTALQGSIGGQLKLAAEPSLLLAPGGVADGRTSAFTALFAAADGRASGSDPVTAALAALAKMGDGNQRTPAETSAATASLDAQLQGLARLSNNTGSGGARALQTQMLDAWRAFQGNVGAVVASHESARASSAAVESRLESDFQSRSGVNLDEEAANLLRYQQTYAAASRLIQTNAALLDGLLAIVGR